MGWAQRANPTAQAVKRGEIARKPATPTPAQNGGTYRSVLEIVIYGRRPYFADASGTIHRRVHKPKGKAAVKAAKRARHRANEMKPAA